MQLDRVLRFLPLVVGGTVFLFSILILADSGIPGLLHDRVDPPWFGIAAFSLCVASGVAAALAVRHTWPILVAALLGWLLIGLWPPVIVASFCAGMRMRRPWIGLYLLVSCALAALFIYPQSPGVTGLFVLSAIAVFLIFLPALLGWVTYARNRTIDDLQVRALTAERNQLLREEQARAQERVAVAREMHDIVAHRIALITMHAGAMSLSGKDPDAARHASLIRGLGRQALTELRQLLGVLRAPGATLAALANAADIDQLVQETRAAGLNVELTRTGRPRPMPEAAELTSYRIVQESLTNVAKHAGVPATTVTVDYGQTMLTITVTNAAPTGQSFELPSGGLGLIGLGERVSLMQGTLRTKSLPDGGFTLEASLPIPEPTES